MSKQREALELALKAIESGGAVEDMMAAEKAIQEALAEPEQKPMSWYMAAYYDGQIYMPKEPPTRKPLTESELSAIEPTWPCDWKYEEVLAFVRAIEQAHGIGGEP